MKLYFTDRQIPEMSALGSLQRQITRDGAFELFCQDHPRARWQIRFVNSLPIFFLVVLAMAVGRIIPPHYWLVPFLMAIIASWVIQLFYQSALTERLRPYFRRYIEEHRDAISRAA